VTVGLRTVLGASLSFVLWLFGWRYFGDVIMQSRACRAALRNHPIGAAAGGTG
jgi:hypothetical protein